MDEEPEVKESEVVEGWDAAAYIARRQKSVDDANAAVSESKDTES